MNFLQGPSEKQMEVIKLELNEDSERLEHNLELFKTWVSFQEHLPKDYDPRILPIFLRGCKHDLERAKRKLEIYFSVRKNIPEIFANMSPACPENLIAVKLTAVVPLPKLNDDGNRVSIIKLTSNNTADYNMEHIVRMILMTGEVRLVEETPIAGDIFIIDGDNNVSAAHVAKVASTIVSKALAVAHEAFPQRLKRIHVLNMPDYAEKILGLIKAFMKEKMRNRFIVHKTKEELGEYINADILPKDYCGKMPEFAIMHEQWNQYMLEKSDFFKRQENIKATGPIPKHLAQSCALSSNEGLQGSFRKLAID